MQDYIKQSAYGSYCDVGDGKGWNNSPIGLTDFPFSDLKLLFWRKIEFFRMLGESSRDCHGRRLS